MALAPHRGMMMARVLPSLLVLVLLMLSLLLMHIAGIGASRLGLLVFWTFAYALRTPLSLLAAPSMLVLRKRRGLMKVSTHGGCKYNFIAAAAFKLVKARLHFHPPPPQRLIESSVLLSI